MDVNVRFTGIDAFEFTDEVAIFDLLGMQLVHGWLVDPQAGSGGFIAYPYPFHTPAQGLLTVLSTTPCI